MLGAFAGFSGNMILENPLVNVKVSYYPVDTGLSDIPGFLAYFHQGTMKHLMFENW